jgi:hypothetical protein
VVFVDQSAESVATLDLSVTLGVVRARAYPSAEDPDLRMRPELERPGTT